MFNVHIHNNCNYHFIKFNYTYGIQKRNPFFIHIIIVYLTIDFFMAFIRIPMEWREAI